MTILTSRNVWGEQTKYLCNKKYMQSVGPPLLVKNKKEIPHCVHIPYISYLSTLFNNKYT